MKSNRFFSPFPCLVQAVCLFFIFQFTVHPALAQYREVHDGSKEYAVINGMSFLSPSTGYVAFYDHIGFTTDSGSTFKEHSVVLGNTDYNGYSVNLTFGFYSEGVVAFSPDSLFNYGHFGWEPSILFSADSGRTWKLVYHRPLNPYLLGYGITGMTFPGNGSTGFAVHDEEVLVTHDRGQTWSTAVSVPYGALTKLNFPSPSTGYAIGGDKLYTTNNGGASWSQLALPVTKNINFNNVCFPSLKVGYISETTKGVIYRTVNSGASWTKMNDETIQPVWGKDMYFTNDSTGYLARPGFEFVYKTTDSAAVWETCKKVTAQSGAHYDNASLFFYNEKIGWAGSSGGYLTITTDGGAPTYPVSLFTIDTTGVYATNTVNLVNHSRPDYQYRWLKNGMLISTSYNASFTHDYFNPKDTLQLIVSKGTDTDTSTHYQYYDIQPQADITGFTPAAAGQGSMVVISGVNMKYAVSVTFGGVPADSFSIFNDYTIRAFVGSGASGDIKVASGHRADSLSGFTFLPAPSGTPPVVTSFSPASGPVGTVVTIKGKNFNSSAAGNIVYFGAVRATVTAASAGEITCTVPVSATYQDISVFNTDTHFTGYSSHPFSVTFADSSHNFTFNSFREDYTLPPPSGNYTSQSSALPFDVDGDGKPDIISSESSYYEGTYVTVYKNLSTKDKISFAPRSGSFPIPGAQSGDIKMSDIDGDGKSDFVGVTNTYAIRVTRNTSTLAAISTDTAADFSINGASQQLTVEDFDGDGRPDVAVACIADAGLSVLRNNSTPGHVSFTASKSFPTDTGYFVFPIAIASGDLDGDGKEDVVILNEGSGDSNLLSVFINKSVPGTLSFAPKQDFTTDATGLDANSIQAADMDGDGIKDIVVLNFKHYTVYKNTSRNGVFSLAAPQTFSSFYSARGASIDNMDGDGKPDYLTNSSVRYGSWGVYKNTSSPGRMSFDTVGMEGYGGYGIWAADFNGDGKQDILTQGSSGPTRLTIYKNLIGDTSFIENICTNGNGLLEADIAGNKYQWQWDTGNGFVNLPEDSVHFDYIQSDWLFITKPPLAWNGYRLRCITDDGRYSLYSTLHIKDKPSSSVTITASDTAVCQGKLVKFTAKTANTYESVYYDWMVNGKSVDYGDESYHSTYSTGSLKDGDKVWMVITTHDSCHNSFDDTSNVITIRLTGLLPSVVVTPPADAVCTGGDATFTAVTAGVTPDVTYRWRLNTADVGTNSPVFTVKGIKSGDQVSAIVTTGATTCSAGGDVYSNIAYTTLTSAKPISVSIASSAGSTSCAGAAVTFTATSRNTTSDAAYHWLVNGASAGGGTFMFTTSTLRDKDAVKVVLTNPGIQCLVDTTTESNLITMQVTTPVADAGSDKTICGGNKVTIGSSPLPGYTYTWSSIPAGFTAGSSSATVSPVANTQYAVLALSSGGCIAGDTALVTVGASFAVTGLPVSPLIACPGSSVNIGIPAQAGFSYRWQSNTGGFTSDISNPSVSPVVPTVYTLTQTNTVSGCQATGQVTVTQDGCATETRAYPNPATDYIIVETTIADLQKVVFELYDASGKQLLTQRLSVSKKVNVAGVMTGVYKYVIREDGVIRNKGTVVIEKK